MRLILDRLRMDDNFRIMNAIAPTEPAQQEDAAAKLFGRRRGAVVARRRGALLRAVQGARVILGFVIRELAL